MDLAGQAERHRHAAVSNPVMNHRSQLQLSGAVRRTRPERQRGFSLLEVLVATSILGMAVAMTMVVYVAALKRAQHTQLALKGVEELRYASDFISQAVRSASQLPVVTSGGLRLLVPPKDQAYLIVEDTTWLDASHTVQGSKANMKMIHARAYAPAVTASKFSSTARPAGAITAGEVATYFVDGNTTASRLAKKVRDVVDTGDTVRIPATSFGAEVESIVVNNVSNNTGEATVTFDVKLNVDVPKGTKLTVTSGRRMLFEVVGNGTSQGDLRYYPDSEDLTKFTVLARDIAVAPLTNPANASSAATVPFAIPTSATNYVALNLQKVPKGTLVGRTLQGIRTNAYTRTDPSL